MHKAPDLAIRRAGHQIRRRRHVYRPHSRVRHSIGDNRCRVYKHVTIEQKLPKSVWFSNITGDDIVAAGNQIDAHNSRTLCSEVAHQGSTNEAIGAGYKNFRWDLASSLSTHSRPSLTTLYAPV